MRLLKTGPYAPDDIKFELFDCPGIIPPYAILSHTWSEQPEEEVTFADIQNNRAYSKPGAIKLRYAITQAAADGLNYVWVDSCCIDKSSSAELTETINSMFEYYRKAQACYAFISDVSASSRTFDKDFANANWWCRGWTLQELLAPQDLTFYDQRWRSLGTKWEFKGTISSITSIDERYLKDPRRLEDASVAQRMSWAAKRVTTRPEDIAYCLMGIFGVNMPMLYGEGAQRAFLRLQEEIMRSSDDQSLFIWLRPDTQDSQDDYHGLLADSPKGFEKTGNMRPYTDYGERSPYLMTNRGLRIEFHLTAKDDGTYAAALCCPDPTEGHSGFIALFLKKLPVGHCQYARVRCGKLGSQRERGALSEVYIRQKIPRASTQTLPFHFFQLYRPIPTIGNHVYNFVDVVHLQVDPSEEKHFPPPVAQIYNVPQVYKIVKVPGYLAAAILIHRSDGCAFILLLGSITVDHVGFDAFEADRLSHMTDLQNIFRPQAPGTWKDLSNHRVRVSVNGFVVANRKVYTVDVEVIPVARNAAAQFYTSATERFDGLFSQPSAYRDQDASLTNVDS